MVHGADTMSTTAEGDDVMDDDDDDGQPDPGSATSNADVTNVT